ncbi:MAG: ATP-binding protein [Flavobacteriales bacterium]|nr:ATP-binding protein [Flavobacteriales bacterium]
MELVRIAIVGPESSGKTTLCEALMHHFLAGHVTEGAREYLEELDRPYTEDDVLEMARGQARMHQDAPLFAAEHWEATGGADGQGTAPLEPVFFDTDTVNFVIWSREKFGRVHPTIERLVDEVRYDWRLLCRPDMPWEPDPLRENPHDRDRLFDVWVNELRMRGLPFTVIEGPHEQRMDLATLVVEDLMRRWRR